jgi:K(+)-stimulated pyrophosphate-energized sodium pump
MESFTFIFVISVMAIIFALFHILSIFKKSPGNQRMQEISELIHKGAKTFLNRQYKILIIFVIIVVLLLAFFLNTRIAFAFILGSLFSGVAGNVGMRIATKSNARTAEAARRNIASGFRIAFSSGIVTGMFAVGLGLFGIALLYYIFREPEILYGFGFGASAIALFARVAGGIYTKGADVAADLTGKIELKIPEDDSRNPAVIADQVGDNVGDVTGMGADLFESYVDAIIAAIVLGMLFGIKEGMLALLLPAFGIIASILGSFFLYGKVNTKNLYTKINLITISSALMLLIISYFYIKNVFSTLNLFWIVMFGLVTGLLIGFSAEYYTSTRKKPTKSVALAAVSGAGTNIMQGIAVGMLSVAVPVLVVCATLLFSFQLHGLFGIAISAVSMLSILGVTLASDAYGPVADNAAGIAEMSNQKKLRSRIDTLDELGNSTAAIGKGFAIGSAALTTLALLASYFKITSLSIVDITKPIVISSLFVGVLLPFLFSSVTIQGVRKTASKIVENVRLQFKDGKIMKGKKNPNYEQCIAIASHSSLTGMLLPCSIAIAVPVLTGLLFGAEALAGLLVGAIASGFLLAVFMANTGGTLDNAKKYIEEGNLGGKGSKTHEAAVIGDTVGDPLKDTAGPSLNILIKLITIIALIFAPFFI